MRKKNQLEGLMVLLLFGVFAVCLLAVLLTGANTYNSLTQRDRAAHDRRVCVQYLASRVRQADRAGGIRVGEFGAGDALEFVESLDGTEYVTYVYVYDGYLMELFSAADNEVAPQDGEKIMPVQALSASLDDGCLALRLTMAAGDEAGVTLSLRSGEEAAA